MSAAGSDPQPFELSNSAARQHAPATLRNREPIAAVLGEVLPQSGLVLELSSGTGEHAVYLAGKFPQLVWQPSDMSDQALASIAAHRAAAGLANLRPPLRIDLTNGDWPLSHADAMFCANMAHIAPWAATLGLFAGAGRLLDRGGVLVMYGPFLERDVETAPSNLAFDRSLKDRNPVWGLRNLADIDGAAAAQGFIRERRVAMPANNLMLIYRRA